MPKEKKAAKIKETEIKSMYCDNKLSSKKPSAIGRIKDRTTIVTWLIVAKLKRDMFIIEHIKSDRQARYQVRFQRSLFKNILKVKDI